VRRTGFAITVPAMIFFAVLCVASTIALSLGFTRWTGGPAGSSGDSRDALAAVAGCDGDVDAPALSFLSPSADVFAVADGTLVIEVAAEDAAGIEEVRLYVDDEWLDADDSAPFSFVYAIEPMAHRLTARALDRCGNSAEVSVEVSGLMR
jgi:hypothetical protein